MTHVNRRNTVHPSSPADDGETTGVTDGGTSFERRTLCAKISVEVGSACPLTQLDRPIHDVNVQYCDTVCHVEALVGNNPPIVVFAEASMESGCLGGIFREHRCYPTIKAVDEHTLTIRLALPSRDVLSRLVSDIRNEGLGISITQLSLMDDDLTEKQPAVCDLSILTEKEREALTIAVERGYFSRAKRPTLDELAADLGISDSAFSYRLRSAQAKLIHDLFHYSESR